jgi:hypothetical protein
MHALNPPLYANENENSAAISDSSATRPINEALCRHLAGSANHYPAACRFVRQPDAAAAIISSLVCRRQSFVTGVKCVGFCVSPHRRAITSSPDITTRLGELLFSVLFQKVAIFAARTKRFRPMSKFSQPVHLQTSRRR